MRRLATDRGVIEHTFVEPFANIAGDGFSVAEALRPGIFHTEQPRIGVLVVIPAEGACSKLALHLDASGYDVWAASTGRAALDLAERTPLDIILLDLDGTYEIGPEIMVSGFRVLHLLGRLRQGRSLAVVVLSALDFTEVEGPVRANADDFINKPVEPAQLLCRLWGAFDRVRTRYQQQVIPAHATRQVAESEW